MATADLLLSGETLGAYDGDDEDDEEEEKKKKDEEEDEEEDQDDDDEDDDGLQVGWLVISSTLVRLGPRAGSISRLPA
jgi:hypothetical protein